MLSQQEIRDFHQLSQWLHPNSDHGHKLAKETLAAVSLLGYSSKTAFDLACSTLLTRSSPSLFSGNLSHLTSEEKLVLLGIHIWKWSYQRLGSVLKKDRASIEKLIWATRLKMVSDWTSPGALFFAPGAAVRDKKDCPPYSTERPWPQIFLDNEMTSQRERWDLQHHMECCECCRESLVRHRKTYFQIQKKIENSLPLENAHFLTHLENLQIYSPNQIPELAISLRIFLRQTDIQAILIATIGMTLYFIYHNH